MRRQGNLHKRLTETCDEVARLREALRVLDEQVAFQESVAEEAESRAVVAETPLAARERRETVEDLGRLRRQREETAGRLAELAAEQDELLDRLLREPGGDLRVGRGGEVG